MTFSQDWMVPACRHPISETISQHVYDDRHGDGYKANISYAVTGSELAPLDRAQHDFAERLIDAAAHTRYEHGTDIDGFISISIGFRLLRAGDFASIEASGNRVTSRPGTQSFRTTPIYDSWFMHVPTGQLLRFDDLMQYADVAAESLLHNGRTVILERFSRIYVSAPTEAERAEKTDFFARRISQATGLPSHEWRMSLYFGDPCAPAILLTFDTKPVDVNNNEYISIHSSLMSWRMFMKPQYRDAIPLVD
ncbi:hypothetical protein [Dokdonella sp.]|uniref:hypothetical protein n=1 Tax=Dokdonella sp. TaxID=2291710 RepID=UPI003527E219